LDETGLSGEYAWSIKVKSFERDALNAALKEIGLALTPERRNVEYIVVWRSEGICPVALFDDEEGVRVRLPPSFVSGFLDF
jgi:hypothetical protein